MTFLFILEVTEILCSFRLVLEGKTDKEIPKSSRLEFLEKFLANNLALTDVEDNISGWLNRGGIADLPLRFFVGCWNTNVWKYVCGSLGEGAF